MAGEKEAGILGAFLLAIMAAIYISGLVAFFYLKTRKPPDLYEGFLKIFFREAFVALWVTLAMCVSSGIGVFFWSLYFPSVLDWVLYMLPYAISFYVEALLALIWLSYIYLWKTSKTWLRTTIAWIGLFLIFTAVFVFTNAIVLPGLLLEAYSYISSDRFITDLVFYFTSITYQAFNMLMNPEIIVDYFTDIIKSSGGNQFLLVKEFSLWSIFLIGIALIGLSMQSISQLFHSSSSSG